MKRLPFIKIQNTKSMLSLRARRGSTFVVVVALLGLLSLLGTVFYVFSAQERSNAEFFAESAKHPSDEGLDVDVLWDWALEQLVVGPDDRLKNSALWGKRHSLVANMFGRDLHPFDGRGVNVILDGTNNAVVDQDFDTNADASQNLLDINDSPSAHNRRERQMNTLPEPDVDYTYPDINNLFLAYRGDVWDGTVERRIIIPSFHRPQYLRPGGVPLIDWYSNNATVARILRPHPGHVNAIDGSPRFGTTTSSNAFPFARDPDGDGTSGEQGVWSSTTSTPTTDYEYDVDNDGDNLNEGIWLDLDFPVQETADGSANYIPLFSFTVYDADALINLNSHGNLKGLNASVPLTNAPFGAGTHISESNYGLSPSEVNPEWALDSDPRLTTSGGDLIDTGPPGPTGEAGTAFAQHNAFFGHDPTNRQELANMEWWFLVKGRAEYSGTSISDLFPGRNGESNVLFDAVSNSPTTANTFPFPGVSGDDDNNNANEGGSPNDFGGQTLAFLHPLDFAGSGYFVSTLNPKTLNLVQPFVGNPSTWIQYAGYGIAGIPRWNITLGSTQLMNATQPTNALVDDPAETILEPNRIQRPFDEPFTAEDMALLHVSSTDVSNTGATSRLASLFPFNFDPTQNNRAVAVRQRFTTQSWDRTEFGLPGFHDLLGRDGKPGIANKDDDGNGKVDDLAEIGFAGSDDDIAFRYWEFRCDADIETDASGNVQIVPDGHPEFPPQFGGPGVDGIYGTTDDPVQVWGDLDPFRPQLRRLLTTELGNRDNFMLQRRLSVNGILDIVRNTGQPADVLTSPLEFRRLTPHATDTSLSSLPSASPLPAFPPTTPAQQEFWARRDRQQMARDLYVLLYTLGGGDDSLDYTTTNASNALYSDPQLKEMAQFAVNLVNQLDTDDAISRFEYDKDLNNGWGLDDDPYSAAGDSQPGDRAVVEGVEAQRLTFSEVLGIKSAQIGGSGSNHAATLFDDTTGDRYYLFVELRSTDPTNVSLFSSATIDAATGVWRVRREQDGDLSTIDTTVGENVLTFLNHSSLVVPPGGQFVIGTSDGTDIEPVSNQNRSSDFRVDLDLDSDFDLIAPNRIDFSTLPTAATQPSDANGKPKCDLDLVHADHAGRFELDSALSAVGGFLTQVPPGGFDLILERRRNVELPALPVAGAGSNGWVEADRMHVDFQDFAIFDGATAANISDQDPNNTGGDLLDALISRERVQPLRRAANPFDNSAGGAFVDGIRYNTLGHTIAGPPLVGTDRNSQSPATFDMFQPHFDRDFSSVGELLSVPLTGPAQVTLSVGRSEQPPDTQYSDYGHAESAAAKFLLPDNPTDTVAANDNRWYRLFEFLEVPTRTHRQLGDPLNLTHVPGKINLNTVRDSEVLGALVDDNQIALRDYTTAGQYLVDQTGESGRDWWLQFLWARDGTDPVSGLVLPGVPEQPTAASFTGSQPFRSFSFLPAGNKSLDHTLLRALPLSAAGRRLFELGNESEHTDGSVNSYNRHRLLSKIMSNTTTRSNVFIVFVSVGFFEADVDATTGALTIGGPIDIDGDGAPAVNTDTPDGHRGFFIIDRSDAEKAYNTATRTFDWRALVKYRLTIN